MRRNEGVKSSLPIFLEVLVPRTELLLHLLLSITRGATAAAAVTGKRRVMMVLLPRVVLVLVLLDRLPDAKHM
jgi:hypothetical protein